jgi:hypothetical protein
VGDLSLSGLNGYAVGGATFYLITAARLYRATPSKADRD